MTDKETLALKAAAFDNLMRIARDRHEVVRVYQRQVSEPFPRLYPGKEAAEALTVKTETVTLCEWRFCVGVTNGVYDLGEILLAEAMQAARKLQRPDEDQ